MISLGSSSRFFYNRVIVAFRILYTSGKFEIFNFKKQPPESNPSISPFKPQPSVKMPSTRSKSSRTITPSQKKHANQEVDPPRGPRKDKKRQKSPPKSTSSSDTSSDESEEQVAPRAHKQGLDPANCEFTLQHTVYLDGQRIAGTSKQYKLSYLTFPEVWQESIDKAGEAAEKL